jgi:hypothetical protein
MPRTRATEESTGLSADPTVNQSRKKEQNSTASWERFVQIAEYEINDPYRSITNSSTDSPWNVCREVSSEHAGDKVALVCHSSCPSLRAWTLETDLLRHREQRKRKNKKGIMQMQDSLGRRPEGLTCCCDYNPVSFMF